MDGIIYLKKYGVTFTDEEEKEAKYKLKDKHWYKYSKVVGFLRRNHFKKIDWYKIQFAYRSDIVIRRIIDEFLKGYEETIESRIMNLSAKRNWSLSTHCLNIEYMDWSNLNRTTRTKKNNAKIFFEQAVKKISDKNDWKGDEQEINFKIIDELNFGQKSALFSIINNKAAYYIIENNDTKIETLFNNFTSKSYIDLNRKRFESELNKMRILRNVISHINILFTGKRQHAGFTIKELIASLDFLMGNYTTKKLKEKIEKYMENAISLNEREPGAYNVQNTFIKKLIKANIKEMFNG